MCCHIGPQPTARQHIISITNSHNRHHSHCPPSRQHSRAEPTRLGEKETPGPGRITYFPSWCMSRPRRLLTDVRNRARRRRAHSGTRSWGHRMRENQLCPCIADVHPGASRTRRRNMLKVPCTMAYGGWSRCLLFLQHCGKTDQRTGFWVEVHSTGGLGGCSLCKD